MDIEMKVRQMILNRRKECGIGLCGSCEAIANWLFREHNVVVSTSWVAEVIAEERNKKLTSEHPLSIIQL